MCACVCVCVCVFQHLIPKHNNDNEKLTSSDIRKILNDDAKTFQAAIVSILLYGCTTLTLTKRIEKRLDGNYTRMLWEILNRSWRQYSTKQQLYGHLPPITKTIQVRRTTHEGHYWRNRDKLIRDVLLWTPSHGRAKEGRPARTYIQQLCEDTACSPEDQRERWRETVRDIHTDDTTRWWWQIFEAIYIKKIKELTKKIAFNNGTNILNIFDIIFRDTIS